MTNQEILLGLLREAFPQHYAKSSTMFPDECVISIGDYNQYFMLKGGEIKLSPLHPESWHRPRLVDPTVISKLQELVSFGKVDYSD